MFVLMYNNIKKKWIKIFLNIIKFDKKKISCLNVCNLFMWFILMM